VGYQDSGGGFNLRTGTIWMNWTNNTITTNEQTTADVGDTTDFVFQTTFTGGSAWATLQLINNYTTGDYHGIVLSAQLLRRLIIDI